MIHLVVMKLKPWTMMFGGAFACALLCLVLIYVITVTGNLWYETIIYILVFLGFGFAAGGYLVESRYQQEHPEEFELDIEDE